MPFDVRDDLIRSPGMPPRISMERVRKVSAQDGLLPPVHELAHTVGSAKDGNVGVFSHDQDVVSAVQFEKTAWTCYAADARATV
jgi:hypothetical protein